MEYPKKEIRPGLIEKIDLNLNQNISHQTVVSHILLGKK